MAEGATTPGPGPRASSRLALMWTLQSQFAGYVLARERQLPELEFVERVAGRSPMLELLEGGADYGIVSPAHILGAGERSGEVVLVALFMTRSPVRLVGLRSRVGDDLKPRAGLRVGVWSGEDLELRAMLALAGFDLAGVEFVPVDNEREALLSGEVDYVQATTYNELPEIVLAAGGEQLVVAHDPTQFNVDVAKDGLVVRRGLLEVDPAAVSRFVGGAVDGWRFAREDPVAAVAAVCRAGHDLLPEKEAVQLEHLLGLFDPHHELGRPLQSDVERARRAARAAGDPRADAVVLVDDGPWERACV